jgi:prophage endopeptidase
MCADPRAALIKLAAGLVWSLAVAAGCYHWGDRVATARDQLAEVTRTAKAVQAQADADAQVLADERALRHADQLAFTKYQQEQANAQEATNRLISDLRRGAVRLRIPVVGAVCAVAPDGSGPAAGGTGAQGYADLDPGTAENLVRLTDRGDSAIRKHAEVVDRYERLRVQCTTPPPTEGVPP